VVGLGEEMGGKDTTLAGVVFSGIKETTLVGVFGIKDTTLAEVTSGNRLPPPLAWTAI
jgi:hypothetical protein